MLKSDSCSCCPFFFAIPVFSKQNSFQKEVSEMTRVATNLMKAGKFEKSLIKSRIALKFAIAIKDDNGIATTCYNTIAATFDELSEPDKAFFYYQKDWYIKQNH
jgi:hypothetical protein